VNFTLIRKLFACELPRLVLFDLDGTLIDSVPDIAVAVDRTLAKRGCPGVGEDAVRGWVGRGSRRLLRDAFAAVAHPLDERALDEALAGYFAAYLADCANLTRLMPGAAELIDALGRSQVALACVTNKPAAITERVLVHFGLRERFARVSGGDSGVRLKPAPDALLRIAAELDVLPRATLMIGDSRHDVDAARAAGMPVLCVACGYNHGEDIRLANPDLVVDDLRALLA
jgi:phosphoglycolate phosphatase